MRVSAGGAAIGPLMHAVQVVGRVAVVPRVKITIDFDSTELSNACGRLSGGCWTRLRPVMQKVRGERDD